MLVVAGAFTVFLVAATVLPLLPFAHGIVRVGDFPRQQFLALAVTLAALLLFLAGQGPAVTAMVTVLGGVAIVQTWYILPFTPLWRKQSAAFEPVSDQGEAFRLVACNVKMSNRRFDDLVRTISDQDPDIMVLMEVDDSWNEALAPLLERFTDVIARPQENSYGMVVASKLALSDTRVACLLTEGVPSVTTTVSTPGGQRFRLYAIHPEPPVPHRETVGRDGETALVALEVRDEALPVVVTGDLNDVAWSRTTERFRKVSRLLDPRIGRSVFSTFDARYPLIRWPLDHLFHSAEFRLKRMRRLPPCGSDHFPVLFDLVLCPDENAESEPKAANGADIERSEELVDAARERGEKPIGSDWEN
jgi:endonuclease/exonuclease/phosphatase (EEP) superfamily protein YafD